MEHNLDVIAGWEAPPDILGEPSTMYCEVCWGSCGGEETICRERHNATPGDTRIWNCLACSDRLGMPFWWAKPHGYA